MKTLLCYAALLALASSAAWAQTPPNPNRSANRPNDTANTTETAQPDTQEQTPPNASRRSGGFHGFHSFTPPPRL